MESTQMTDDENEYKLNVVDVAKLLDVSQSTVVIWRNTRGLPFVPLSKRRVRYSKREVLAWQSAQRATKPSAAPPPTPEPKPG